MGNHIFKQQTFVCAGCGKTHTARVSVPVEQANDGIAPPEGWTNISFTAQHPKNGSIATLVLFLCAEGCADKAVSPEGSLVAMIKQFKEMFAKGAKHMDVEKPAPLFDAPKVD